MTTTRRWYPRLYVLCIVIMSIQTLIPAFIAHEHFLVWLAATEIAAAVGMLVSRVRLAAFVLLIAVFLVAAAHNIHEGHHLPTYLVLYAVSAAAAIEMLN